MILLSVSAIPPIMVELQTVYSSPILAMNSKLALSATLASAITGDPITKEQLSVRQQPVPRILSPTSMCIHKLNGETVWKYTQGTRWYNWQDTQNIAEAATKGPQWKTTLIRDLMSAGMQNNIIACWEVPDEYIGSDLLSSEFTCSDENQIGGYTRIDGALKADSIVYTPYSSYAQGVVNNKARYGQSATVKVYNPASGASLTKHIYDALPETALPGTLSYTMPYRVAADIRPDGCPIFSFQYNDGGTDQLSHATEYIKGGTWAKVQVNGQGVSGSYFDKLALNNARDELNTRTAIGLIGSAATLGVTGAVGGIKAAASLPQWLATQGNGIGEQNVMNEFNKGFMNSLPGLGGIGIAGTLVSYAMSIQKLKNQEELLNARCITAVAPIKVGNSDFMNDTGMNRFYYVFTSYSGEDMRNFDEFLTRFGYRVGKMHITNRHLYSRKNFVYIKANEDLMLISNDRSRGYYVGKQILDKVCNQLQQGVRIWRKKPDAHDLLPDGNNIKEDLAYRPYD